MTQSNSSSRARSMYRPSCADSIVFCAVLPSISADHVVPPRVTERIPSGRNETLLTLNGTSIKASIRPAGAPNGFSSVRPNSSTAPMTAKRADTARRSCASIPVAEEIGINRASGQLSSFSISPTPDKKNWTCCSWENGNRRPCLCPSSRLRVGLRYACTPMWKWHRSFRYDRQLSQPSPKVILGVEGQNAVP